MSIKLKDPKQFRQMIIKKGLTQRELSNLVGASEHHIGQMIVSNRNVGPGTAARICATIDVPFEEIFIIT